MNSALSRDKVFEIVGNLGTERTLQIIDTGATERELLEAKILALQGELPHAPREDLRMPVVHQLYEILRADMIEPEEPAP